MPWCWISRSFYDQAIYYSGVQIYLFHIKKRPKLTMFSQFKIFTSLTAGVKGSFFIIFCRILLENKETYFNPLFIFPTYVKNNID